VDGFQGQEAEVVLFSCVRSALGGRIGFLSDLRRQNVALTRAKHSLVLFARASALKEHDDWKPFVDHLERKDRILDTGDFNMEEVFLFSNDSVIDI
jgi:senataxin